MDQPPCVYTFVHRSNTRKRAATGTWINVQGPTPPCTGRTHGKKPTGGWIHIHGSTLLCTSRTHGRGRLQVRGSTSRGLHPRAEVEQSEKAATGPQIYVQGPTHPCTGQIHGKGRLLARGFTSRGLKPRSHVEHAENGGYRHVDARPGAYTHVHKSYTRKRAAKGTWIHVQAPTPTCTGRTHKKRRLQARGSTSRGQHPRALVEHAEKGGDRYVDPRSGAYTPVHGLNTRKRTATGTLIKVQGPTPTCTGRTRDKGRLQARGSTSMGLHPRAQV